VVWVIIASFAGRPIVKQTFQKLAVNVHARRGPCVCGGKKVAIMTKRPVVPTAEKWRKTRSRKLNCALQIIDARFLAVPEGKWQAGITSKNEVSKESGANGRRYPASFLHGPNLRSGAGGGIFAGAAAFFHCRPEYVEQRNAKCERKAGKPNSGNRKRTEEAASSRRLKKPGRRPPEKIWSLISAEQRREERRPKAAKTGRLTIEKRCGKRLKANAKAATNSKKETAEDRCRQTG
jgi:hypothetical protein